MQAFETIEVTGWLRRDR